MDAPDDSSSLPTTSRDVHDSRSGRLRRRRRSIRELSDPSLFDVVTTIFSYLSARDLRYCSQVCRSWAEAASRKIAIRPARFEWESVFSRMRPEYINHIFRNDPEPLDAYVHAFFRNEIRTSAYSGIVRHPDVTLIDRVKQNPKSFARDYFGYMRSVPQLTLCFSSAAEGLTNQLHEELVREGPKNAPVTTVGSRTGVICTTKRPNEEITLESDGKMNAISLVSLPVHEGLRCYVYTFSDPQPSEDLSDYAATVVDRLPSGEWKNVKGILAFAKEVPSAVAVVHNHLRARLLSSDDFKDSIQRGVGPEVALAGGLCQYLRVSSEDMEKKENVMVFLCGDERLHVHSFVLKSFVRDKKAAAKIIGEKAAAIKAGLPQNITQGIGFQCACLGRGKGWYGQWNVEADAFRQNFPDFPLFGFFGDGEIGNNSQPLSANSPPVESIEHSYCTAFMVIACSEK